MESLFKWLAISGRLSNLYADQHFKDLNINSSHHLFIIHICERPGLTQDSFKNSVYIHPSNITRALDHLEKEGYIIKETLPEDKRTCKLYPTEKAKKAYAYIKKVISEWNDLITEDMSEEEVKEFAKTLEKVGLKATKYFFKDR